MKKQNPWRYLRKVGVWILSTTPSDEVNVTLLDYVKNYLISIDVFPLVQGFKIKQVLSNSYQNVSLKVSEPNEKIETKQTISS